MPGFHIPAHLRKSAKPVRPLSENQTLENLNFLISASTLAKILLSLGDTHGRLRPSSEDS